MTGKYSPPFHLVRTTLNLADYFSLYPFFNLTIVMQDHSERSDKKICLSSVRKLSISEKLQYFDTFSNSIAVSFIKSKPNKAWL